MMRHSGLKSTTTSVSEVFIILSSISSSLIFMATMDALMHCGDGGISYFGSQVQIYASDISSS
jgi:hypothetical protein